MRFFSFSVVTAAIFCIGVQESYAQQYKSYWQLANRHSFCKNFPAGKEADGRVLYISQASHSSIGLAVNITIRDDGQSSASPEAKHSKSWHLGKAGVHLKDGMTYSYGGKEYDVRQINIADFGKTYQHQVFCLADGVSPSSYKWIGRSNGESHPKAVRGYNSKEQQVVCRAGWEGGIHPGKLIPSSGACYIGYGGGEKAVGNYEVLILAD